MDDVIDKFISEPVSVTSVSDGWVFSFSTSILEQLLISANSSPKKRAIVFVTDKNIIN